MESIYKILLHFVKVYDRLSGDEQKKFFASFINRISLNEGETIEERTLKSIVFNFAIPKGVANEIATSLDKEKHVETVVLISRAK